MRAIADGIDAVETHLARQENQRKQDKDDLERRLTHLDTQRQHGKEDILRAIQNLSAYRSLSERAAVVESKPAAHQ